MAGNLIAWEGPYEVITGGLQGAIASLARFDTVVLSHGVTVNYPSGVEDTAYPEMNQLILGIRGANPQVEIFGYVAGTVDYPGKLLPGGYPPNNDRNWSPANGVCAAFIDWVTKWKGYAIDGIFIDLVPYMDEGVLADLYSFVKLEGLRIMANSTEPDLAGLNVSFAGMLKKYLDGRDYVMIEGANIAAGKSTNVETKASLAAFEHIRPVRLAFLTTEDETAPVNLRSLNAIASGHVFLDSYQRGDCMAYCTDLLGCGTITAVPPLVFGTGSTVS